jgi:hypothetical protein
MDPAGESSWCLYARWWVDVKGYWRLRVTVTEKTALVTLLNTC